MEAILTTLLDLLNETLASAIVIVAASLLLYNLTRNLHDRVARASAILLATVTTSYMMDVFVALDPSLRTYETAMRLQWIGIAFMPAALFHLSDALLATTGLPSRGRRRRIGRALYLLSAGFLVLAVFTDVLVEPVTFGQSISMRARSLFPVYAAYFVVAAVVSFHNVNRARNRCLTRSTRRRMGYLQFAMVTPALGIFPFSVFITPGQEFSLLGLVLVNAANVVVILMLIFLAYPLSFFSARVPDRVVKQELLRFLLLGPGTAMLALAAIIFVTPATRILGLPGQDFLPFAVVAVVLLWQWFTALALPYLEKWLVYPDDDYEQLQRLQDLSERLLTRADLIQLQEAILAQTCDYLRVSTAFVASINGEVELVAAVGPTRPAASLLQDEKDVLVDLLVNADEFPQARAWQTYWVLPLHSGRATDPQGSPLLIGFMAVQARSAEMQLETEEWQMLRTFVRRAGQTLDDLALHAEIMAALEGLLPQMTLTRARAAEVEFKPGHSPASDQAQFDREQFVEQVKAALKHYWGGPGLTGSRLLDLAVVRDALVDNDHNPARALRAVLERAIENQRPEGERKMTSPEWTLYNILELRYVKRAKVKEVAPRLALSEPDLYRKQNLAIQNVAEAILRMERECVETLPEAAPPSDDNPTPETSAERAGSPSPRQTPVPR